MTSKTLEKFFQDLQASVESCSSFCCLGHYSSHLQLVGLSRGLLSLLHSSLANSAEDC